MQKNHLIGVIFGLVITVSVVLIFLFKYGINSIKNTSFGTEIIVFKIDRGDSVTKIAKDLFEAGLIDSPLLFKLYVRLNNLDKSIQAGTYEIPPKVSIVDIVKIIQKGRDDIAVTFIEGWSLEESAMYAADNLENVDYADFIRLAKLGEASDNYLFPDTYFFFKDITTTELIDKIHLTFNEKTEKLLADENLKKVGLTKKQAVIFASIIEREVSNEKDRLIVAGILINRWLNGEKLDADATTQYAITHKDFNSPVIEWWPKTLTTEDLQDDSPYNTRKNMGLPPTPISSFGLSALAAVINYKSTEYNYYLTDADGVTHYAKTLIEHEANSSKYL